MNRTTMSAILILFYLLQSTAKPPHLEHQYRFPRISKHPFTIRNLNILFSKSSFTKAQFTSLVIKTLQDTARKEDQQMCEEIATDFVNEHQKETFDRDFIKSIVEDDKLLDYAENWKKAMYVYLIDYIEEINRDFDQDYLDEVLDDPDFFGLTYDSYKILSFNPRQ